MSRVVETGFTGRKKWRYCVELSEEEHAAIVRSFGRNRKSLVATELNRIVDEALEDLMLEDDA